MKYFEKKQEMLPRLKRTLFWTWKGMHRSGVGYLWIPFTSLGTVSREHLPRVLNSGCTSEV
jgi:hypothetical protein